MHGARGAVYAGEKIRGGREVRTQGPEALSDEKGRGYVSPRSQRYVSECISSSLSAVSTRESSLFCISYMCMLCHMTNC